MSGARKKLIVRESAGVVRPGEMVTVSVPCARGDFQGGEPFSVSGPDRQESPCQIRVLKRWPDGSAKWLLVDFAASVGANGVSEYTLAAGADAPPAACSVQLRTGDYSWEVDTGKAIFTIDTAVLRPFLSVRTGGMELLQQGGSSCLLGLDGEAEAPAAVDAVTIEEPGPLRAVISMAGCFGLNSAPKARFFCRLHFHAGSSAVNIEFTLHNPNAARHPGGLWDLGDPGSLEFKSLNFSFPVTQAGGESHCVPRPGAAPLAFPAAASFSLYQESSGGENWCSPVHRNRHGVVPMQHRGFRVEAQGKEIVSGLRATPLLWHGRDDEGIAVAVPKFWQEFPAELSFDLGNLQFHPFPARFPDLHELQGGEQKTHQFWVDFSAGRESLSCALNPVAAYAAPEVYRESGILSDLPGEDDLVDSFADVNELMAKREVADEYGWRNFGEVYADHEAAFHQGTGILVSHYNNQYDLVAGLYRKFFATGDAGWHLLAGDLARHVRDIDLYHTDGDREEYNRGLFWHTDHYVDAGTSSHRSFSREHLQVKPSHLCGGGPGAEHCYTTGLALHYFQTANPLFREAVISLAKWELLALAGPQTVLAAVKRGVGNFNCWRFGRGSGQLFPRYPFTRGTGNAITACLDAFEVGGGRSFLDKSEELVRGAIHPEDDIEARDLLNAERAWSYTVMLAAVVKFLDKKSELGERGAGFDHARDSLLIYAEWMLENEYPYLGKPEILEFPNETWAAQDLRKSAIFYHCARYAGSLRQRDAFHGKARFFWESSTAELKKRQGSGLSRPVALMLQNGWVGSRLAATIPWEEPASATGSTLRGEATPPLSLGAVAARTVADLVAALGRTSISRELSWLRARLTD